MIKIKLSSIWSNVNTTFNSLINSAAGNLCQVQAFIRMAILKDGQMLEVEINSIRWNLSDLCSVAFVGIVIFKLLSRLGS